MKSLLTSILVMLTSAAVLAADLDGTGDIGSVGGVVPMSVISTSDKIQQYSPQHRAVTIFELCKVLSQKDFDWGKNPSQITCAQVRPGILALTGRSQKGAVVIYANATDKTVIEYFGDSDIQQYQNNLGQSFSITFEAVNTGVKNVHGAAVVQGYYKVDAYMRSGQNNLRIGAYSNL
jgi:hypothetical protein